MSRLRYNHDCPTCRKMPPAQAEQTRRGGEWRIRLEGRTLAHAVREADAKRLVRILNRGMTLEAPHDR